MLGCSTYTGTPKDTQTSFRPRSLAYSYSLVYVHTSKWTVHPLPYRRIAQWLPANYQHTYEECLRGMHILYMLDKVHSKCGIHTLIRQDLHTYTAQLQHLLMIVRYTQLQYTSPHYHCEARRHSISITIILW